MAEEARPDLATMRRQVMQAAMEHASPLTAFDPGKASPMEEVPWAVRVAVASAPNGDDKIATLKKFYPDAVVRRTGGETVVKGQPAYFEPREDILFTHPGTPDRPELKGRVMRYDPHWYDPAPLLAEIGSKFGMARTMGAEDSRSPGQLAMDVGKDVAGTAADAATMLIGGTGSGVASKALQRGAAERFAGKEAAGMGRPDVLAAGERLNVPTEGMAPLVTESKNIAQKFWQFLRNPKTADQVSSALSSVDDQLERKFGEAVEATGGRAVSKGEVGAGVQSGLEDLQTHVMKGGLTVEPGGTGVFRGLKNQGALETAAMKAAKGERDMVPVPQLRQRLQQMIDVAKGGGEKPDTSLVPQDLLDLAHRIDANGGQLPMDYLRKKRSWMGENGGAHTLLPASRPELEQAYGGATDDLAQYFQSKGGRAFDLWEEGQANYRGWVRRRDALREIANSRSFEQAADIAARGGTDAKSGLRRLEVLTESLGPQELADLKRMKLAQLGMKGQGELAEFNLPTFLKGWKNSSNEMRDWLTQGNGELRQALDDLYTVGERRQAFMGARDPGTAGAIEQQKSIKANVLEMLLSPITSTAKAGGDAVGILTTEAKAQLMTNPKFVRWLAEGGKLPADGSRLAEHIGALAGLVGSRKAEAELAPVLQQYVQGLRQEEPSNPFRPHRAADLEAMASADTGGGITRDLQARATREGIRVKK